MPVDLDPTSTSANLSDLIRALLLLLGGGLLFVVLGAVMLMSRRWVSSRSARHPGHVRSVDPWAEAGRRIEDPTERERP